MSGDLVGGYEQLRGYVLQGSNMGSHAGLVLLMRQGVVGWMRGGRSCCVAVPHTATKSGAIPPIVTKDVTAELVHELANMAMADRREIAT